MNRKTTVADITLKTDIYIVTAGTIQVERMKSIQPSRSKNGYLLVAVSWRDLEVKHSDTQLDDNIFLNFEDARMKQLSIRLGLVEEAKKKLDKAMDDYNETITKYGFDILTPKPEHEQEKQI